MERASHDFHAHTTYSDGSDVATMVEAAAAAGLSGIGFSDHCVVYEDPFGRAERTDFDRTYPRRREEIRRLRDRSDVEIYDGVEVNYDPDHEAEIREFLCDAGFDYAIGSVHYAGEYDIMHPDDIVGANEATRRNAVARYFEWQERLIESGLFDVVGHLDLPVRAPALRAVVTDEDYRGLVESFAGADAVPEINASALADSRGTLHPQASAIGRFADAEIPFVVGTDSHVPAHITETLDRLESALEGRTVEWADPALVVRGRE